MAEIILNAKKRILSRKSANKALRREGKIPGIFYYKSQEPMPIEVTESALKPLVYTSEAHIISLQVENQNELPCILKNVQFDPVTDRMIHFDLQGISRSEKIEIEVPVVIIGNPVGIKQGGIMQQVLHKFQIKCLPGDIPEHIEVNATNLNLGDSLHISDINFEKFEILNAKEAVIVSITAPRVEKETLPAEGEEITEPEVISKGKAEKEE